jgi:hypothetical protein
MEGLNQNAGNANQGGAGEGFEKLKIKTAPTDGSEKALSLAERIKLAIEKVVQMFRERLGVDEVTERITANPFFETERNLELESIS